MLVPSAFAQSAAAPAASGGILGTLIGVAPLLLIFVAFYFLLIRPQSKRMKTLQATIAAVKRGDSIVTAGGIIGKVTKVEDTFVEVEIASNTRVRVVKATIAEVTPPAGAKPAND
ncbi:preprotein translocase subunit YajC [Sphingomonas sp. Leaf22]|uniref:preprotein translocase subunit YajC n=1 Tax=Sphingomonas sp. Leaf22 TaxID=1735687 RepID=UPI0006F61C5D|nr:preprotein translocase subunit YajC [Sphingomonas sp. Leaf22]KQM76758.1 preprotein translocase subunit YajC [Sphingomonas sp. Leaf22]